MFKQFILQFFPAKRPMLGRWCLHDKTKIPWKIDMANIDHCGTCAFTQNKINKNVNKKLT
jgi:Zn ribbon nucleic-acid-binding protein